MSGKGSLGPRDFYVSEGYIQNPLVRGPAGMGMKAIPLESYMDPMLQRDNYAPFLDLQTYPTPKPHHQPF